MGNTASPYLLTQTAQPVAIEAQSMNAAENAHWLKANGEDEKYLETQIPLRQPYIDPLQNADDLSKQKNLPRIFRFGSGG